MTFHIVNSSCSRRLEDMQTVYEFLDRNGWREEPKLDHADFVILFTCAFNQSRVTDMLCEIRRIKALMKVRSELIVGGCLPKTDSNALSRAFSGKTLNPQDFSALTSLKDVVAKPAKLGNPNVIPPQVTHSAKDKPMAVFVAEGCHGFCSYCAIRFATGPLRSKSPEVITQHIRQGLSQGYTKFDLRADSIGDYGLDLGTNLGELIDRIMQMGQVFSIGLFDLHPTAFLRYCDKIKWLCKSGRIHYLYVPLQSGNERILKLMNRACDVKTLKGKLGEIRQTGTPFPAYTDDSGFWQNIIDNFARLSHACVRNRSQAYMQTPFLQSGVIIGFPGETETEFDDTVTFLSEIRFHDTYVHFYSDMPNTQSSLLPGKISKTVMCARHEKIIAARIPHNIGATRHEWNNIKVT